MDAFSLQMTQQVEKTVGMSAQTSSVLKECVQEIENSASPESALFTQLAMTQRSCQELVENTNVLGPKFHAICESISKLDGKDGLSEQMKDFSNTLSEVQRRAEASMNRPIERQEIESQIQKAAAELKAMEDTLKTKDQDNETTKQLLLEARDAVDRAEARAAKEATGKSEMQDKMKNTELAVRTELSRASIIARDQVKAKFEQQIHELVKEKDDKEKDLGKAKEELEKSTASLVMSPVY